MRGETPTARRNGQARHPRNYVRLTSTRRERRLLLGGLLIGAIAGGWIATALLENGYARQLGLMRADVQKTQQSVLAACRQAQAEAARTRDLATASATLCRQELEQTRSTVPPLVAPAFTPPAATPLATPDRATEPGVAPAMAPLLPLPDPVPSSPSSFSPPPALPALPALPAPLTPPAPPALPAPMPGASVAPSTTPLPLPPRPPPRPRTGPSAAAPAPPLSRPSAAPLPPVTPPSASMGRAIALHVGEEATIGAGVTVRLIAVSRRNTGKLCIVGADGMETVRIPSSKSVNVTRQGRSYTLSATVENAETCRIAARAN